MKRISYYWVLLIVGIQLCSAVSNTVSVTNLLQRFLQLDSHHLVHADFLQSNQIKQHWQNTCGELYMAKSNKFLWQYYATGCADNNSPVSHDALSPTRALSQQIVSDGHKIYVIDHQLQQVTITAFTQSLHGSLVLLFSGDEPIDHVYRVIVNAQVNKEGIYWLHMTPLINNNDPVQYMDVAVHVVLTDHGYAIDRITQINLVDQFANNSKIYFYHWQQSLPMDKKYFQVNIPAGYDILTNNPLS
jgi:outer membrane lipoprotein-sorting protein